MANNNYFNSNIMNKYVKIYKNGDCVNKIKIRNYNEINKENVRLSYDEEKELIFLLKLYETCLKIKTLDKKEGWIYWRFITGYIFEIGMVKLTKNPNIFFDGEKYENFVAFFKLAIEFYTKINSEEIIKTIFKIIYDTLYEKTCYTCKIFSSSKTYDKLKKKKSKAILISIHNNLVIKKNYGFKFMYKDIIFANIKYYLADIIFKGDQWTMIHDYQMEIYKKNGFKVEVFGSPFNTRLKYFGSIFLTDNVFGRIGTFEEIMDKLTRDGILMWRNEIIIDETDIIKLVISPPSSRELIMLIIKRVYKLFKKRTCIIHLGVSYNIYNGRNGRALLKKLFGITEQIIMPVEYAKEMYTKDGREGKIKKVSAKWYNILLYNTEIPEEMKTEEFRRNIPEDFASIKN